FYLHGAHTTATYTLSLHDALPIWRPSPPWSLIICTALAPHSNTSSSTAPAIPMTWAIARSWRRPSTPIRPTSATSPPSAVIRGRSEEHTSELQSRENLVCRLLLEK